LRIGGEEQVVVLDNYIPCNKDGNPAFAHAHGNEMWPMLIEKAWAKVHGSYERIIGGQAYLTIRDLTGAPSFEFSDEEPGVFEMLYEGA